MTILIGGGILLVGLVVGVLSALLGIGGGIVLVPFMVFALGMDQTLAEGTSLLVIIPTSIVGVASHLGRGYVSVRDGLLVGAGGVAGAIAGALLALALPADILQSLFGVLVLVVGGRMIVTGFRMRRSR